MAVNWLGAPKKLPREQSRVLNNAVRHNEPLAISAVTLLEVAVQYGDGGRIRSTVPLDQLLVWFDSSPFETIPFDTEIAAEVAAIGGSLRDPADRAIVATARVHRLKLITSDQRIIDSGLVPVIQ